MSINKVIILGHIGEDPELKQFENGSNICSFNVATNANWTDKNGEKQESTEWHRVIVWGKRAEHCKQYLSKGEMVAIEGSLQTRAWSDKENVKHYTTEIVAIYVQFINTNKSSQKEDIACEDKNERFSLENYIIANSKKPSFKLGEKPL